MLKINKLELLFATLMVALVLVLVKAYGDLWWTTMFAEGNLGQKMALGQITFCCVMMISVVFFMASDKKETTKITKS